MVTQWKSCDLWLLCLEHILEMSLGLFIHFQEMGPVTNQNHAPTYLQPHYGNGVFGNVYLLALNNTKHCQRPIAVMGVVDTLGPYSYKESPIERNHSLVLDKTEVYPELG